MKNVLVLRTEPAKYSTDWKGHSAWLWSATKTKRNRVYAHKDGYLKRILHISDLSAIVPRYNEANLTYRISEVRHAWTMRSIEHLLSVVEGKKEVNVQVNPDDTVYCAVDPVTVAVEMKKEDVDACVTVKEFIDEECIFWDKDYKNHTKSLKDSEFVRVFANKQTHGIVIPIKEFVEKYAQHKIFCYLRCNSYYVDNKRIHNIVLF